MTTSPPGDWITRARMLRLAEELADLRIAAANALGLPLDTTTTDLATALNELAKQEGR